MSRETAGTSERRRNICSSDLGTIAIDCCRILVSVLHCIMHMPH